MEAKVVKITPKVANELLSKNKNNRRVSEKRVMEYAESMASGDWLENGESIIIDSNHCLKDGQHRLLAVLKSNKSFKGVLVTGVDPNVMQTIDVGKNRSLADVLSLYNVKNTSACAGAILKILAYDKGLALKSGGSSGKSKITNSQGIAYYFENSEKLDALITKANALYVKQNFKIFSPGLIAFYLYVLTGLDLNIQSVNYLTNVMGIIIKENTAATWINKKIYNAKVNKDSLNRKWLCAMIIKGYNIFKEGDYPVGSMKFNIKDKLPEVAS